MRQDFVLCVVGLCALLASRPASAQTFQPRQPRPDWGIFGSGVSNTGQKLILTASFGAGLEDNLGQPLPPVDGTEQPPIYNGPFTSAGATLVYSVDKTSTYGDVGFSAYGRNYKDMKDPFVGTYSAFGDLNFKLSKKASLATSYFAGQYLQNLSPMGFGGAPGAPGIPGAPAAPNNPGVFTTGDTYRAFGASAVYNHHLTAKMEAQVGYSYYAHDSFSTDVAASTYDSQWVYGGLRYSLAEGLGLRAGYRTTLAGFIQPDNAVNYRNRGIDAGVDYSKSLSVSRKSRLSFGTGFTAAADQSNSLHYYFIGNVTYSYQLGRTWSFYSSLARNVNFYNTLGQPTVDDSFNAGLGGLIGRRVTVQSGVSAWRGSAVGNGSHVYSSASAYASMRVALNRVLGVSGSYYYYRYGFSDAITALPPGFVQRVDSQTIQVSLDVFAPLFTQARRPNAAR
jgi:hypothetical protein